MRQFQRTILVALAALAGPSVTVAQTSPPAREIVDRYVEAVGGERALRSATAWKATGSFAVPAAGLNGTLEVYQSGGRTFARITVPGLGELLRGFDGTVGWSMNPIEGPRVLEGEELAQTREEAQRGAALRDSTVVTALESLGQGEMNGEACWRVKVTWKSGRETEDCYSIATGLLVATTGQAVTPMGTFEYTTLMNDYQTFGDLRIATRVVNRSLGQEQVVTTEAIEFGPVDAARFALPAEIKALVGS